MVTPAALVQRLGTVGSDLPDSLAARIVALGSGVAPLLLRLLEGNEEPSAGEVCTDCGERHNNREWARSHAVDLLTQLREPAAMETMLRVLAGTPTDEPLHDKIVERLPEFGAAALEPILAALARTPKDAETAESLCCILSALGVRDERILSSLLQLLENHPRAAAMYLAEYGDAAACPALLAVILAFEPDVEDSALRMERLDLLDAYAALGGELPATAKAQIDAWLGGQSHSSMSGRLA
jgi:hypothetical protein